MTVQCCLNLCYPFHNIFKPWRNWFTWCKFGHLNCNNTCMSIKAYLLFNHILFSATTKYSQFWWACNKRANFWFVFWLSNQYGLSCTLHIKRIQHTHTHTHTICLPSDLLLFQHALPTFTSADIFRHSMLCLDGMAVCSQCTRKRGQLYCHDLCHGHPTFYGRGPKLLLQACSWAACGKNKTTCYT